MLKEGVRVELGDSIEYMQKLFDIKFIKVVDFQSYHGKVNLNKWFLKEIHILKEIGAIEPCQKAEVVAKYRLVPKRFLQADHRSKAPQ